MNGDSIKEALLQHMEKFFLLCFVGLAGYLVYSGLQKPMLLSEKDPKDLASDAQTVANNIVDTGRSVDFVEERVTDFDIVEQTNKLDQPVDPTIYSLSKYWAEASPKSIQRRDDPAIPAPVQLQVQGVTALLAYNIYEAQLEQHPLNDLEPAEEFEKVEIKKPKKDRDNRDETRGGDDQGGGDQGGGMDMGGGGMDGMGFGGLGMGPGGDGGGSMANSSQSASDADLSGYRPSADGKLLPSSSATQFIAGMALVPHRELYKSFEEALSDAQGYKPARDTPIYFDFEVQRADVTDKAVDQLVDGDWLDVWERYFTLVYADGLWRGFAPEVVPVDYRDDNLTMVIPPVLMEDYRPFSVHPALPTKGKKELELAAKQRGNDDDDDGLNIDDILNNRGNKELRGPGAGNAGGFGQGGMGQGGGPGQGGGMDMSMGGMFGMARGAIEADPVDHKLIRFYDIVIDRGKRKALSPKPGRRYVYRVRYGVVDPNFPAVPTMQPKMSSLQPEVAQRVLGQVAKFEALPEKEKKKDSRPFELFMRYSDWSAPSSPVSLVAGHREFVGPVMMPKPMQVKVGQRDVEMPTGMVKSELVAGQISTKYDALVPITLEVHAGSMLAAQRDKKRRVDLIDPLDLKIKKLPDEDAKVVNPSVVVDIRGGKDLDLPDDEELQQPGLLLMVGPDGRLRVHDNVGDQRRFRIYSFAPQRGL